VPAQKVTEHRPNSFFGSILVISFMESQSG